VNTVTAYEETKLQNESKLVNQYAPLVKRIAHHLQARLPRTIQIEDLIQSGMIGLLEAAGKYDESKGASFETYAGIRIRGTMLDEVRKVDWVPRSVYRNSRRIAAIVKEVENKLGRDARDVEIAEALDISLTEYHLMLKDSNSAQIYGFDDIGLHDEIMKDGFSERIKGPLEGLQQDNFRTILAKCISNLPDRERLVITLYYEEELNLKEIGKILGVSESRVCQIHSQASSRLRTRFKEVTEQNS